MALPMLKISKTTIGIFVLGVNLIGVLNCMRAEINAMKEHGSIVNASSVAGIIGMPKNGAYVASKHAVIGLTRVSAKELGERGIRVNAIAPYVFPVPRLSLMFKCIEKPF